METQVQVPASRGRRCDATERASAGFCDGGHQPTSTWVQHQKQRGFSKSTSKQSGDCGKFKSPGGEWGEDESQCGEVEPVNIDQSDRQKNTPITSKEKQCDDIPVLKTVNIERKKQKIQKISKKTQYVTLVREKG